LGCKKHFLQRAALKVGQLLVGRDISYIVLPSWFRIAWIPRIITWILLGYMFYKFAWYYGVITIIIDVAITTFCPVPESDYEYIVKKYKKWEES
jgi:hypothetical protein